MQKGIVRQSKFRHLFGTPVPQDEHYKGIKLGPISPESTVLKANTTFFAFAWPIGGTICVVPLTQKGAISEEPPLVLVEQNLIEFNFNPFDHHQLAAGCEDGTVKIFKIPEGGLTKNVEEPLAVMEGAHSKRILNVEYHPLSMGLLTTVGADNEIKLWDLTNSSSPKLGLPNAHKGIITCLAWNYDGSLLATTCKDKNLRVFDPRGNSVVGEVADHQGAKSSRVIWHGKKNHIYTIGFTKGSDREIAIYDPRKLGGYRVSTVPLDHANGLLLPHIDEDLSLLYLSGKGEGNIRIFELTDDAAVCIPVTEFKSNVPMSGVQVLPKSSCNLSKCEVLRVLKLTTNSLIPIRFEVPRQHSDMFQEDLYPPTWDMQPTTSAAEWLSGATKPQGTHTLKI